MRERTGKEPPAVQIGAQIRRVREAQDLSQQDLADRLGRTQASVSQWESGRRSPSVDDLVELAALLDHDVRDFLPERKPTTSIPALLRAEVAQLDFGSMATVIEAFLSSAERLAPREPELRVTQTTPRGAAQQLLARAAANTLPIPVDELARQLGANVLPWRFSDALSGLVITLEQGPVIGINKEQAPVRRRFTLAHEIGHLILGHGELFHLDLTAQPEDGDPPGYQGAFEREANDFAANLLMPDGRVLAEFASDPSAERLADKFKVSALAMRYRLANLGVR